jgi:hypothetical protein
MEHHSLQTIPIPLRVVSITTTPGNNMQQPLTRLFIFVLPCFENLSSSSDVISDFTTEYSGHLLHNYG